MGIVDLSVYRKDFPMLDHKTMNGYPLVYFDNAATSFPKPNEVYSFMDAFYRNYGGNAGRGGRKRSR